MPLVLITWFTDVMQSVCSFRTFTVQKIALYISCGCTRRMVWVKFAIEKKVLLKVIVHSHRLSQEYLIKLYAFMFVMNESGANYVNDSSCDLKILPMTSN